jgi:hypothetical protein
MKIKTSEATELQLDWLVAKCEGHESRCPWLLEKEGYAYWQSYENAWGNPLPKYSTKWAQGGPIIDRERTEFDFNEDTQMFHAYDGLQSGTGPTHLIAAMRCYVASKLGDEVEVPDELQ